MKPFTKSCEEEYEVSIVDLFLSFKIQKSSF